MTCSEIIYILYVNVYVDVEKMKTTIKDVAKKANVSVATVSRVINKLPGYTQETEKIVLEAIEELGFHPNELARGLVGKSIKTIGVLIPTLSSMVATEILGGIEDAAHKNNHSIIICNTDSNGIRTMEYLNILIKKRINGLLIVSEKINKKYADAIKKMKIPVVLISTYYDESMNYIKVHDKKASHDAVEYLIQNGHIDIAMISGTKDDEVAGIPRVSGYMQALGEHGIVIKKENVVYGDFSFESGKICMESLIKKNADISAVFCASDEMAAGAISAAYEYGIKVPEQLSIMGYDDTKLASMLNPPLTSVSQSFYDIGCRGLDMLISKINGNDVKNIIYPHKIIERKTVKALLLDH